MLRTEAIVPFSPPEMPVILPATQPPTNNAIKLVNPAVNRDSQFRSAHCSVVPRVTPPAVFTPARVYSKSIANLVALTRPNNIASKYATTAPTTTAFHRIRLSMSYLRLAYHRLRRLERVVEEHCPRHGPHAAGHGGDPGRFRLDLLEPHVADQARPVAPVDADVHHDRSLLDVLRADHLALPGGHDEDVGLAGDLRQVSRARVADGHGGVLTQEQL